LKFGTDGIRGRADHDLTPDVVVALGRAAARVLGSDHRFVLGRDTRESCARITADLVHGLALEGAPAVDAGVLPTPAIAYLAAAEHAPAAMVSASHNPWPDNGVKLFAPGGRKLDDVAQEAVEEALATFVRGPGTPLAAVDCPPLDGADDRYVAHLGSVLEGRRLDGVRVVLDCANGAASATAPRALRALGAQVVTIHAAPNGRNINEGCGSTAPGDLQRAVVAAGADAGLAFDGDADRVIAVDEQGVVVDGDQMMVIAALDLHARGQLRNEAVAVTVMSNLGLRHALTAAGIGVVTTPVGDRSILDALHDHGLALGGEQSGHVVFADHATTGDGTLTGLVLLDCLARSGERLSVLAAAMQRYPQVLENVAVGGPADLDDAAEVWDAVRAEEAALGGEGRVLVRASGTEPVVRVMVEAPTEDAAIAVARRVAAAVRARFGG
jgi:phosphoglucosamine mutase